MTNPTNQPAPFAGFFGAEGSQPCSIEAALSLGLCQPHEDPECLYTRAHGKVPYSAAHTMGLVDQAAIAAIQQHPNVFRLPRVTISEAATAPHRGRLGEHEGTPAGAVTAALQRFISTRSDEDAAGFAKALEAALKKP